MSHPLHRSADRCALMAVIVILFVLLFPTTARAAGGQNISLRYRPDAASPETEVSLQAAGGRHCLMLPSSADYSHMTLAGPAGATLSGKRSGASLQLDETGLGKDMDLTTLFGDMKPGVSYVLTVSCKSGNETITETVSLIKSDVLSSLHISLDVPLTTIHEGKSASGSGYLVKLSPTGEPVAEAEVESLSGRGNASWTISGNKRPYNVNLKEGAQLIDGAGTAKSWCLLSNNVSTGRHDRTGLYNTVAMTLFQQMGGSSALSVENVDLYVNRQYRGTYLLTEKAEIQENRVNIRKSAFLNEDTRYATRVVRQPFTMNTASSRLGEVLYARTNVTLKKEGAGTKDELLRAGIQAYQYATGSELKPGGEGGYLLELDFRFPESRCWFVTRQGAQVVIREPEYASYEQVREIALFFQEMEDGLFAASGYNRSGRHYSEYLDLYSLALRYSLDALMTNCDAFLASEFFYTDRAEDGGLTLLQSGPAWDFDYGNLAEQGFLSSRQGRVDGFPDMWLMQVLTKGDFFRELQDVCLNVLRPLWLELNEGGMDALVESLAPSQKLNQLLWENNYSTDAPKFAAALQKRYTLWYDKLWQDSRLQGVQIVRDGDGLTAKVYGTASGVRWYRVDPMDGWTMKAVKGAVDLHFVPGEDGIYLVTATGKNVTYSAALQYSYRPLLNGKAQAVTQETITLTSAPVLFQPGKPAG